MSDFSPVPAVPCLPPPPPGSARPDLDRRAWLLRTSRLGLGLLALTACESQGNPSTSQLTATEPLPAHDPQGQGRPAGEPALDALPILHPVQIGQTLPDSAWRLDAIERAPDRHLTVRLTDVQHGGTLELELFQGPSDRHPLAQTASWEIYSYNGARGNRRSPEHVLDAAGQLALLLAERENSAEVRAIAAGTCTFARRQVLP